MRRKIPFLFLVLIVLAALCSCGLDMFNESLNYPPRGISSTGAAANFLPPIYEPPLNTGFEANFLGIEFYYRIYNNSQNALSDAGLFSAKQDAEIIPGSTIASYLASPLGLKYRKLSVTVPKSTPITDSSELAIEVYINNRLFLIVISPSITTELYRNIPGSTIFSVKPESSDADFQYDSASGETVFFVQLYAVSYGIDFSSGTFNSLSSKAIFIGVLTITF